MNYFAAGCFHGIPASLERNLCEAVERLLRLNLEASWSIEDASRRSTRVARGPAAENHRIHFERSRGNFAKSRLAENIPPDEFARSEHANNISGNLWLRPGWMPGCRVHSGRRRNGTDGTGACKVVGSLAATGAS